MEISQTQNGLFGSIIVAEQYKRRIHIIGRFGRENEEPKPYEAFLVVGEEWTDGFEFSVEHELEDDKTDKDEWDEDIQCLIPEILWGERQEYAVIVTDEHRALVSGL